MDVFDPYANDVSNVNPMKPKFSLSNVLADPNMQRFLALMGSQIGGPGSAGEVIGGSTTKLLEEMQKAKAVEKQGQSFKDQLRSILGGGDVSSIPVTPKEDFSGFNSITIGDKDITLKAPRIGGSPAYSSNKPLEGQVREPTQSVTPSGGGRDLLPFFSSLLG